MTEELISYKTAILAKKKGFCSFAEEQLKYNDCIVNEAYIEGKLKYDEDGFRIKNLVYENNSITPTEGKYTRNSLVEACSQSLLQRWLREEHKIYVMVEPVLEGGISTKLYKQTNVIYELNVFTHDDNVEISKAEQVKYNTYEKCLEAGLLGGLKLIK